MRFLPDTNVFIMWMAQRNDAIVARMARHRREIVLSAIVQHELLFGAYNSAHVDRNLRKLDGFGLPMLPFDRDDARAAADVVRGCDGGARRSALTMSSSPVRRSPAT